MIAGLTVIENVSMQHASGCAVHGDRTRPERAGRGGVPVNEIGLPDTVAVGPVGRPLSALRAYEEVPPLTAISARGPRLITVHDVWARRAEALEGRRSGHL